MDAVQLCMCRHACDLMHAPSPPQPACASCSYVFTMHAPNPSGTVVADGPRHNDRGCAGDEEVDVEGLCERADMIIACVAAWPTRFSKRCGTASFIKPGCCMKALKSAMGQAPAYN